MVTIIATMFLPGLLLGVGSCWHKNMIKTIVAHPSVVLMPTFTNFTFQSRINWCKGKEKELLYGIEEILAEVVSMPLRHSTMLALMWPN